MTKIIAPFLLIYLVMWSSLVSAEDNDIGLETDRRQFATAVELFDQGQHEEALAIFQELQRVRSHPVLLYNISWCLSRLGRHQEALAAFETYLYSAAEDDRRRIELASAEVERLRGLLASEQPEPNPTISAQTTVPDEMLLSPGSPSQTLATPSEPVEEPISPASPAVTLTSSATLEIPTNAIPQESSTQEARGRRRLRPLPFWAMFGLSLVTAAAMTVTGALSLIRSERWIEQGNIEDRDVGRRFQDATDGLLVVLICESIATLVLGLLTDFNGSRRGEVQS